MSARYRTLFSALVIVTAAACGSDADEIQQGDDNVITEPTPEDAAVPTPADAEVPDAAVAAPVPSGPSNLPCDVEAVLAANCQRCHGETAKNGTPLMTRAHLMATSAKDPAVLVIDRVLLRSAETEKPMPPTGKGDPLTEESRAVLENWVEHGMPSATCVK